MTIILLYVADALRIIIDVIMSLDKAIASLNIWITI